MDTTILIAITVAVTLLVVAGAWLAWSKWRTKKLKEDFGPEYEHTVADRGDKGEAEKDLAKRKKRVEEYDLRPLTEDERQRFSARWDKVQKRFVDQPGTAISDAHALVEEAMKARGYPIGDIRRQQEDLSVETPVVVEHYRRANAIAGRNEQGEATTEDLRKATVHYREIFRSVLAAGQDEETEERAEEKEVQEVG